MAQQSTTEPREAPKVQGKFTREQQKRIINHAAMRYPKPGPGSANEMSTGHREIQRGAHDESEHRKRRADD